LGADKTHPDTRPGVFLAASAESSENARSRDSAVVEERPASVVVVHCNGLFGARAPILFENAWDRP
jgi:hypothetical protein